MLDGSSKKRVNFSLFREKDTKWAARSKLGRGELAALSPRPSKRKNQKKKFENVFFFVLSRFKNKTKQARPPKTVSGLWHLTNQVSKCYRMRRVSLPESHFTVESMYFSEHQRWCACVCVCVCMCVYGVSSNKKETENEHYFVGHLLNCSPSHEEYPMSPKAAPSPPVTPKPWIIKAKVDKCPTNFFSFLSHENAEQKHLARFQNH